ncbi:MAG: primosomal protein N' [Coriobacteriales bacterium]|nr:primosomal protein N' [Coriobacteriales bacterium]
MGYHTITMYASVVLDISTRALDGAFTYEVPAQIEREVQVGATVLVSFGGRTAVGYVMELTPELPLSLAGARILPIRQVLAPSAFDTGGAQLAQWMAREYAANLPDVLHLFLAPGQDVRVRRSDTGSWELVNKRTGAVDDRWVSLTEEGRSYEPRKTATKQREILAALADGHMRMAELCAMLPGASSATKPLVTRGVLVIEHRRLVRGDTGTQLSSAAAPRPQALTRGQKQALEAIDAACSAGKGDVVLVDGVTGSGKTEVYLQAIECTLAHGKGAIVLVPEISLTAQTVGRFRARFGERVAVLHSRLSTGERFDQWDLVRQGIARVVVGARSALFAPLSDPGLIVIDEEHEGSYKQDGTPRYHAREAAAELARVRGAALVLGSATPSLESLHRCRQGEWRGASWTRVEMPERPGTALLPQVHVVDMASEFRGGGRSIFSARLVEALGEVVEQRKKAVLLLNRRGFATFLMCRDCGCVPECPHCSTSLTYHERTHSLMCHTCGRSWPVRAYPHPSTCCPNCGSRFMAAYGVGTQRVEDELTALLSELAEAKRVEAPAIIRMDADTTREKGAHQRLLEQFDAAECAVLVGTQMIAKGLDFPEVILVGVINADTSLKLPDFRAAERTYALLEQVAGRAGRGELPGKVIVQTYWATHPAIQAAAYHDRSLFLQCELSERAEAGYPPFARVSNVVVWGTRESDVRWVCDELASRVRAFVGDKSDWQVLGPADCIKAKVKDRVRRHVVIKSPVDSEVGSLLGACVREIKVPRGVSIAIDVDAHDMM